MMMNKNKIILFFLLLGFLFSTEINAQYGKKTKRRGEEEKKELSVNPILNNLWYGVNINNIGLSNVAFSMGVGPMAAYKFNRVLSAGIITDLNYTYFWRGVGNTAHYFDYAGGVFGRAKIFRGVFAHAEYNYTSLAGFGNVPRQNFPVVLLGAGYSSGRPPWGYEISLTYDVTENLGRITGNIPIKYRIGITYNFQD